MKGGSATTQNLPERFGQWPGFQQDYQQRFSGGFPQLGEQLQNQMPQFQQNMQNRFDQFRQQHPQFQQRFDQFQQQHPNFMQNMQDRFAQWQNRFSPVPPAAPPAAPLDTMLGTPQAAAPTETPTAPQPPPWWQTRR